MSNISGYVEVVQTGTRFTNTTLGDLAIYTDCNTQAIHVGVTQNSNSLLRVTDNLITTNYSVLNTGSNPAAFSNIRDVSSNWLAFSNVGTFTVCNIAPPGSSNGAIDLNSGYFIFNSNSLPANSNIAHSNILSTDFTIESWVHYHGRPRLVSASHFPYLIGNYNITQTDIYWSFGVTSNMQLGFFVNNAGTPALVYTPSNTVPNDTWVHIAMTYSNAPKTVTLYMNGLPMSNLTACNYSGTIFSVSNAWATSATGPGLTSILNTALYPGMGYLSLGRWGGSNPPCYIHDFKMVTGTCYAPSNQPPASASVTPGTRLLLRAAQISQTAYTPLSVVQNGFVGIATSNPAYQMDVAGSANIAGFVRTSNPYYWAHHARNTGGARYTNTRIIFNSSSVTNVPDAYANTGIFTVPVAGTYYISAAGILGAGSGQGGGSGTIYIRKNGTNITCSYWQCNSAWENVNIHYVLPLVVNDQIDIFVDNAAGVYGDVADATWGGYGSFAIFMLG